VAVDSDVFADHPEWVYQTRPPGPEPYLGRYVLNLARPDVYQHVRDDIFRLVQQYHLDYFRTDMNRPWTALADPSGVSGPGRDLVWRHVNAYHRILDEVRAAFPDLIIENCAGGGGRIDLGLLRRTHTTWISDNVDPLFRLSMFLGGTQFLPPMVCESWVVDWPGRKRGELPLPDDWPWPDLDFHFRVSMLGHLGVGADLGRWSEERKARARHHIGRYKELRRTIQWGDLYRLTAPPPRDGGGDWAAAAFVAPDRQEAAAFCFRLASDRDSFRVRIPGLAAEADYDVEADGGPERWRSRGADLAATGVEVVLPDRYSSALLVARRHA
jgi:alpha-galactosidase